MDEIYSVRMRAAEGGPHEKGGFHISGGETLVLKQSLEEAARQLLKKAISHSRGEADYIQLVVEKIEVKKLVRLTPLSVSTDVVQSVEEGRQQAVIHLRSLGVSESAIRNGLELLLSSTNLRGAAVLSASTGQRLDLYKDRGIRATRMGWDEDRFIQWSAQHPGLGTPRIAEAIALATKVAHAPFMVAELCWSDDPEYITGYIASRKTGYVRITQLKEKGSLCGGRIFYVMDQVDLASLQTYLEEIPVWIG
ncbi:6-carboxyhexanoate--CoA ligase [Ammoniphilus sp. YIM 78166]|uniref:6-carboxyhexanoate--CoA ligase n=1 Tax=Ammoniphilus sp. YIM 78166 TaxID=1644106 RepID=UPI00106FA291|nr:6-carboxyhexanoate--CoA ligase [Ammoniphilus sp. YIM 78166]